MIRADEFEIIGSWVEIDGRVIGDDTCGLVESLMENYLQKVGYSPESGGWHTLFRDPQDGLFGSEFTHIAISTEVAPLACEFVGRGRKE